MLSFFRNLIGGIATVLAVCLLAYLGYLCCVLGTYYLWAGIAAGLLLFCVIYAILMTICEY
jgi:hypothetical protein